jgi:type I restriction enzyme S subunit
MNAKWTKVRLGEVLRLFDSSVPCSQLTEINLAGVYSFGRGLFKRGLMSPSETSYKSYNRLFVDDFVISQPKAWEGALARVTPEFEGWYLSPVFPTFRANRERLDPRFLEWFCKREPVWVELQRKSRGIGARRESVSPQQFLSLEIPLPSLREQRRLVARIEELAARINEARTLRQRVAQKAEALMSSTVSALSHSYLSQAVSVSELVGEGGLRNGRSVKPSGDQLGIRCLALSAMRNGRIDVRDSKAVPFSLSEARPFLVKKGDIFIMRGNGSKNLCGRAGLIYKVEDLVIFPDLFIQISIPRERITPEFFVAVWNSSSIRAVIEDKAKTTSGIWKINQGHILSTHIPVPLLAEQRRIMTKLEALHEQVHSLNSLQAEISTELDAFLPSILDGAFKGDL